MRKTGDQQMLLLRVYTVIWIGVTVLIAVIKMGVRQILGKLQRTVNPYSARPGESSILSTPTKQTVC